MQFGVCMSVGDAFGRYYPISHTLTKVTKGHKTTAVTTWPQPQPHRGVPKVGLMQILFVNVYRVALLSVVVAEGIMRDASEALIVSWVRGLHRIFALT